MSISEHDLARELGVSRDLVRKARRSLDIPLQMDGKTAVLPDTEAERVRSHLGAPPTEKDAPCLCGASALAPVVTDSAPAAPPPGQEVVTLRVHRIVQNPHIILATDGLCILRVRVRSSANFIVGMEIPARRIQGDLYELARPCPRARGRW